MSTGRLSFSNTKFISEKEHKLLSQRCHPRKGDLLLSKVGTTGIPLIIDDDREFSIFVSLALIKFFPKFIDSSFLITLLNSPLVQMQVKENTRGVGNKNWVLTAISNTLLVIPPLHEQQRIVEKIGFLNPYIVRYARSESKLSHLNKEIGSNLKNSILQEAIQGKLVPQAPNDEPASILLQRIKEEKQRLVKEGKLKKKDVVDSVIFKGDDNKYYEQIGRDTIDISNEILFDLPCSWQWVRFGQIVRMRIGKTPARGEVSYWSKATIPWVSISDMTNSEHINKTKEKISVAASSVMGEISPVGSLLMSFKLTVGRTSILNIDAYHNEAIISIYPFIDDKYALRDYLFYTLPFLSNMGDSKDAIKGKTLNSKSLKSLLIPLPPLREQRCIINRLEELYAHL